MSHETQQKPCCARIAPGVWCVLPEHGNDVPHAPPTREPAVEWVRAGRHEKGFPR